MCQDLDLIQNSFFGEKSAIKGEILEENAHNFHMAPTILQLLDDGSLGNNFKDLLL